VSATRRVIVEPRGRPSLITRVLVPFVAILGAAAIGALLLAATGHPPGEAYANMLESAFGSDLAIVRTLISATPLILTALAAAVAFRMKIWNIGAEGQLYLGAIAASGVALLGGGTWPAVLAIVGALVAGVIGGAGWAALAAFPRAYLRTDEVITTLMLNFVALYLMNYLIFGSKSFWRDKERLSFPSGRFIPDDTFLPTVWLRLHIGFVIACAVALLLWWLLRSSTWGFDLRVIGDSVPAARYAGMQVPRTIVWVLLVSGAIAGLAGAVLVLGTTHALQPGGLAIGLGYTGIVVAAVSRSNPLTIVPAAILIAGLTNAGTALQILEVPNDIVVLLQGLALLLVAAAEFLLHNRVRIAWRPASTAEEASAA
jgi:simple sugar transport system permease protein